MKRNFFTNDEKWSEYTSRWRKMTWKNVRMTDRRTNRRIKRGRTYLQVSTIVYDWSNDNVKISCSLQRTRACACVPSSGEIEKLKMAAPVVLDKRRKICKINTSTVDHFSLTHLENEGICSPLVQRSWFFAWTRFMHELTWIPRIMWLSSLVQKL